MLLDRMTRESEPSSLSAADVLNHLAVGVALLVADGTVIYLNQSARRPVEQDDGLQVSAAGLRGATARQTEALRRPAPTDLRALTADICLRLQAAVGEGRTVTLRLPVDDGNQKN